MSIEILDFNNWFDCCYYLDVIIKHFRKVTHLIEWRLNYDEALSNCMSYTNILFKQL